MSKFPKWLPLVGLPLLLTGCVDDNYDLSDIDTTTRISVNDLVIPVNVDAVTLDDIIDPDEDSKIKKVTVEGKTFYALTESGEFHSDPIEIDAVLAQAPTLESTHSTISIVPQAAPRHRRAAAFTATYKMVEMGNDFTYTSRNVDEAIIELKSAKVAPVDFRITMRPENVGTAIDEITFTNVKIQMPKGMDATVTHGKYDPATGIWTIADYTVNSNKAEITLTASEIDFLANDAHIDAYRNLVFNGKFELKEGLVTIGVNGSSLPQSIGFTADYTMGSLDIKSLSGRIKYDLDGMNINPIDLNDIPDFLTGDETDITLGNPQIYLNLNNPLADSRLEYGSGLTLTAVREDGERPFSSDQRVRIGYSRGVSGPYNFVLAPSANDLNIPTGYDQDLQYVPFSSLGSVVAGQGLPKQIKITLDEPQVPEQNVTDFPLGVTLESVTGSYDLMAPLSLKPGSRIVYSDREDGWNDEDVDAIVIEKLSLDAVVTNNCPVSIELRAYPLGKDGQKISGVELSSNVVEANAKDVPLTITMTGRIEHLDGVVYEAVVLSDSPETLAPDLSIELNHIRARVTGYYEKEL